MKLKIFIFVILLLLPLTSYGRIIEIPPKKRILSIPPAPAKPNIKDYAWSECMDRVWSKDWWRWCDNMMITIQNESKWDPKARSKTNDHWLFQLHYPYHKTFINSIDFLNEYRQVDYWIWVRLDAKKKNKRCNRYAHPLC